ncbi:MAG TPA: LON peptidase substrate-binding domain-containing protein, partial [Leptospiraceae bacterium]|nr:LON peptidase substrate-binding domain-containing protein [Leptospiraceae bacterium]
MDSHPVFPLSTVLFPGLPLPLHIFEPRYQLMIQRVISRKEPFIVALIKSGQEALGDVAEPYEIGTTASIKQVENLE